MTIRYPCGCYATMRAAHVLWSHCDEHHVLGVVWCHKHTWALPIRRRLPTLEELRQALGAGQMTLPFESVR